ncbi:MAG: hypothetical protein JRE43_01850 [Deltaproteobacteria bacterium]|nr:hypothetical protein [Deltaproteobacteria bacterium]MBW2543280.1 hypothetical protein [Deltaproteobacteria bacterium]
MRRFNFGLWVGIVFGALLVAGSAWSEGDRSFNVKVTVAEISDAAGEIDARAERLDRNLRQKFKYNSLKVIEERRLKLALDEVGSVKLPGGRMFRVQPLSVGERGLLMAVGWEGEVMMDMRAPSNHLLVIGGPSHGDGQLVVSIEPHY